MYFFVHLQAHNYNSTADFTQCLEVMTKQHSLSSWGKIFKNYRTYVLHYSRFLVMDSKIYVVFRMKFKCEGPHIFISLKVPSSRK